MKNWAHITIADLNLEGLNKVLECMGETMRVIRNGSLKHNASYSSVNATLNGLNFIF